MSESSSKPAYDVAVVGAGPGGSACAATLARAGCRVLLLDKAFFPRNKICGETVNPRCWDSFDKLGVADEIARRLTTRIVAVSVTGKGGREIRVEIGERLRRPFFAMGRDILDQILAGAAANAGAEFHDGAAVVRLSWDGCWRIEVRDRKRGGQGEFKAAHLVGADGRNSVVAVSVSRVKEKAGSRERAKDTPAGRKARRSTGSERVGVQWHARTDTLPSGALQMYLFDTGYCGLVNVDGRYVNVSMVTAPELAASAKQDYRRFLERTLWSNPVAASRFPALTPVSEINTTSPINPRLNPFDHPHATLIGDAAQTVEPFTGEGIRCALEDGIAAANLLAAVGNRTGASAATATAGGTGMNSAMAFPKDTGVTGATNTSRFRVNRVFSPILRRPFAREALLFLGARFPALSRWVVRRVVSRPVLDSRER